METLVDLSAFVARWPKSIALRRAAAAMALVAVALSIAFGLVGGLRGDPHHIDPRGGDLAFYARVIDDVRAGQPYDAAVMADIRAGDGAVKPFMTVRPPLLAEALARLPDTAVRTLAVRALACLVLIAWFRRLGADSVAARLRWPMLLAMSTGVAMTFAPEAYLMHEVWAGLLIALALALRTPERFLVSVLIGTLAAVMRELAAPFLVAMGAVAFLERRPKEAAAWLAGLLVFAVTLARHAAAVEVLVLPGDLSSTGWVKFGGWPFVLHAMSWNLAALVLPARVIGCVFPLALLGLLVWRDALGRRVALVVAGYVAGLLFVGRDGNFYWGLIITPLWPMGAALAPEALAWLWRSLFGVARGRSAPPSTASALVR
jgi:hypothetical protein